MKNCRESAILHSKGKKLKKPSIVVFPIFKRTLFYVFWFYSSGMCADTLLSFNLLSGWVGKEDRGLSVFNAEMIFPRYFCGFGTQGFYSYDRIPGISRTALVEKSVGHTDTLIFTGVGRHSLFPSNWRISFYPFFINHSHYRNISLLNNYLKCYFEISLIERFNTLARGYSEDYEWYYLLWGKGQAFSAGISHTLTLFIPLTVDFRWSRFIIRPYTVIKDKISYRFLKQTSDLISVSLNVGLGGWFLGAEATHDPGDPGLFPDKIIRDAGERRAWEKAIAENTAASFNRYFHSRFFLPIDFEKTVISLMRLGDEGWDTLRSLVPVWRGEYVNIALRRIERSDSLSKDQTDMLCALSKLSTDNKTIESIIFIFAKKARQARSDVLSEILHRYPILERIDSIPGDFSGDAGTMRLLKHFGDSLDCIFFCLYLIRH
jgi:hypothetical protein